MEEREKGNKSDICNGLLPDKFSGKLNRNCKTFARRFEECVAYRKITEQDKLIFFPLLLNMSGITAKEDWTELKNTFEELYDQAVKKHLSSNQLCLIENKTKMSK